MGCSQSADASGATKMNSKPTMAYWNCRGRGNSVRYQLAYSGVDYNEKRYTFGSDDWATDKANF